ncbi:MAG: cytochrome c [Planctomycetaceae bacterium]
MSDVVVETRTVSPKNVLLLMLVSCWLTGCGEAPEVRFVPSPRVDNLMPKAQEKVKSQIVHYFGEPDALVAWDALPVEFGMVTGAVVEAKETEETQGEKKIRRQELVLEFEDDLEVDLTGDSLQFIREDEEGEEVTDFLRITSFDPESNTAVVTGEFLPEPDSEVSIGGHELAKGKQLYMKHCLHCHGVSGDASGPTAKYLNPKPRDFRLGLFKFKSTQYSEKPSHEDLVHIISEGIPGTYMPSFKLLAQEEKDSLVEYVRWLSIRGEIEKRLIDFFESEFSMLTFEETKEEGEEALEDLETDFNDILVDDLPDEWESIYEVIGRNWKRADNPAVLEKPTVARDEDSAESRARGQAHYIKHCITCHGPLGYGDGTETETYKTDPLTNVTYAKPGLYDSWGELVKPRNLRLGQFRGGRRPIDVFRRIKGGIPGTPMQAFSTALSEDEQIWDVVNYVLSLPHEDPTVEFNTVELNTVTSTETAGK